MKGTGLARGMNFELRCVLLRDDCVVACVFGLVRGCVSRVPWVCLVPCVCVVVFIGFGDLCFCVNLGLPFRAANPGNHACHE